MHWSFYAIHAVEPAFLFDAAEITDVHYLARARLNSGGRGIRPFRGAASINGFVTLLIAWLVLVAGVLIRGI
jgi:hypothetical protein